ncbi:mucin-2-like [Vespula maculifrons]|uniref:Mucin-2-like n=1 Tax=Vespula maculifrons TaxID=7453 RepID=A0ABD2C872_VESMC
MSQRRFNTQIALCIFFTGLFLGSIEFGQGLKCYQCSSLNDTSCANPSSSHIKDCLVENGITSSTQTSTASSSTQTSTASSSTQTSTASSSTQTSTTSLTESSKPDEGEGGLINSNSITYAENITFSCFTGHFTLQNGTMVENIIIRGCTPTTFSCLDEGIINVDKEIRSCNIEFCQTDQCNSSDMVKMGMISLLLPLITILLRIR